MTNNQFKKNLIEGMEKLGYEKTIASYSDIHFIRRLETGFYISVFLYYDRFEKDMYTAEYHFDFYASSGFLGINKPNTRINRFLKEKKDDWWNKRSVIDFLNAIKITELDFINMVENKLISLGEDNSIKNYFKLLEIEKIVFNFQIISEILKFQPKKEKYGIDPIWYQVCEIYQREKQKIKPSRSTVVHQAVSAYRNYIFEQRYGKPPFFDELLARYNKLLEDEKFK